MMSITYTNIKKQREKRELSHTMKMNNKMKKNN